MLSPKLRNEQAPRQFYLSNHCELVGTRSTSLEHRRQDCVISDNCAKILNKHLAIPNKSSYARNLRSIEDLNAKREEVEKVATKTSTFGFGTTKRNSFADGGTRLDLNQTSSIDASKISASPLDFQDLKRRTFDKRSFSINVN